MSAIAHMTAAPICAAHTRPDSPGYAKLRCDIGILPLDDRLTALTYECRTMATDPSSRREFVRYWRVVSPFVGVVPRATLRLFERRALSGRR